MKALKISLSESTRPSALILGIQHHLVDLYQFCSIMPLGQKIGLPRGSHDLHRLILGKHREYQVSKPCGFRQEDLFMFSLYKPA